MGALSLFRFFRRAFSLRPRDESEPKWRNKLLGNITTKDFLFHFNMSIMLLCPSKVM
jgi:hypothetical protein